MREPRKRHPGKASPARRKSPSGRRKAAAGRRNKPAPARAASRGAGSAAPDRAAVRRQAILDAALTVFAERGYEAARLDDVARHAGVAKGTLYLYFEDKEALFEALVRSAVSPILDTVANAANVPDLKTADLLDLAFAMFNKEVLGTKRRLLLRLIVSEGPRFPALAAFYHREVVSRGVKLMRAIAQRAVERGEFPTDAAARFPQLIFAPLLLAVIWDGLFAKIEPLDAAGLLRAHREVLTGLSGRTSP
jgi:AcrR family transcriptional regulator